MIAGLIQQIVGGERPEPVRLEQALDGIMRGEADQSHEAVIRDLALADFSFFGIVDITGLPWIEIKQPEDIDRANKELLAKIDDHA